MKLALAVVLVCSSFASAEPQVKLVPPSGWTEATVPDQILANIRKGPGSLRADGRMWRSDAEALTVLEYEHQAEGVDAKDVIEGMERSVEDAMMNRFKLKSKRRTIVNNRLVVDARYDAEGRHAYNQRIYAVDERGIVHTVSATCASADYRSPECEAAIDTIEIPVHAVPIEKAPRAKASHMGKIIGVVVILALFVVLVIPRARRKKR